jgi:hypothetical protein
MRIAALGALTLLILSLASSEARASQQSDCQQAVLAESGVDTKGAAAMKSGAALKYRGHSFHLAPGRTIWGACGYLEGFWENAVNGANGARAAASSTGSSAADTIASLQKALADARKDTQNLQQQVRWLIYVILAAAIFLLADQGLAVLFPKKPNQPVSALKHARA